MDGRKFNRDPGQATKNGYLDFITRIEAAAPSLNTYLASDWVNIGTTENGGPIFGSAMDAAPTSLSPRRSSSCGTPATFR